MLTAPGFLPDCCGLPSTGHSRNMTSRSSVPACWCMSTSMTSGRSRRFIDHDNLELKHCQDVLEASFLSNDTAALCSAFQCSHRGEQDGTRIWILPPEQFPEWLKNHPECWQQHHRNCAGIGQKIHTYLWSKTSCRFSALCGAVQLHWGAMGSLAQKRAGVGLSW